MLEHRASAATTSGGPLRPGGSAYGQKTHDTEIQDSKAEGSQEGESRKTQDRQSEGCEAESAKGCSESTGKKGESASQEGCCQARGTESGRPDQGDTFRLVGQGSSDFRYPVGNRFLEEGRHRDIGCYTQHSLCVFEKESESPARGLRKFPSRETARTQGPQPRDGRIHKDQGIQGCALQGWLQAEGRSLTRTRLRATNPASFMGAGLLVLCARSCLIGRIGGPGIRHPHVCCRGNANSDHQHHGIAKP